VIFIDLTSVCHVRQLTDRNSAHFNASTEVHNECQYQETVPTRVAETRSNARTVSARSVETPDWPHCRIACFLSIHHRYFLCPRSSSAIE